MIAASVALWLMAAAPNPSSAAETAWVEPDPSELRPTFGIQWKADLGSFQLLATNHEEWAAPLISEDGARVYVGNKKGRLEARATDDGTLLWARDDLGALGAAMVEFRGLLIVGTDSDLVALGRVRGRERWRLPLGGFIGGPATRTSTVGVFPVRPNGFVAVDLVEGERLWQSKRATPDGLTIRGQARPAVDEARGVVYLGFSDGTLQAVRVADGGTAWSTALGESGVFFSDVDAATVLPDGDVLAAAYNKGLFRLDPSNGAIRWEKPLKRIVGLVRTPEGRILASEGEGQVLGVDQAGLVVWRYRMRDGAPSLAVPLPGARAAITSSRGAAVVLSTKTGQPLQLVALGPGSSVPPVAFGQKLFIYSNGGMLVGLRDGVPGGVLLR